MEEEWWRSGLKGDCALVKHTLSTNICISAQGKISTKKDILDHLRGEE